MQEIIAINKRLAAVTLETVPEDLLREAKRMGTSDEQLAQLWKTTSAAVPPPSQQDEFGPGL